jgi:hypothetical protein
VGSTQIQCYTGREDEIDRDIGHGVGVNVGAVKIDRYIGHGVGVNVADQNSPDLLQTYVTNYMHGTAVGRHVRNLNLIVHTFSVRQLGRSCLGARSLLLRQGLDISGSGSGSGFRAGKGNVHGFNVGKGVSCHWSRAL